MAAKGEAEEVHSEELGPGRLDIVDGGSTEAGNSHPISSRTAGERKGAGRAEERRDENSGGLRLDTQ